MKSVEILRFKGFKEKCDHFGYDENNIISKIVLNHADSFEQVISKNKIVKTPLHFYIRRKNHRYVI